MADTPLDRQLEEWAQVREWCGAQPDHFEWDDLTMREKRSWRDRYRQRDLEQVREQIERLEELGNDPVNHPAHYTSSPARCSGCGKPIECIDITRHMNFDLGNVVRYVWRSAWTVVKDLPIEDLEKAVWYLRDEIAERRRLEVEKRA